MKARRASFEADSVLGFGCDDDDVAASSVGDSLVNECDLTSCLGVLIGYSEGDLGESGKSERCVGVL